MRPLPIIPVERWQRVRHYLALPRGGAVFWRRPVGTVLASMCHWFAVLFLVSCVGEPLPRDMTVGYPSETDVELIKDAAEEWAVATRGGCVPVYGESFLVRHIALEECEARVGHSCIGFYWAERNEVALVSERLGTDWAYRTVVLHELGHYCGLPDFVGSEYMGMLMYYKMGGTRHVTERDVEEWLLRYGEEG